MKKPVRLRAKSKSRKVKSVLVVCEFEPECPHLRTRFCDKPEPAVSLKGRF